MNYHKDLIEGILYERFMIISLETVCYVQRVLHNIICSLAYIRPNIVLLERYSLYGVIVSTRPISALMYIN